jgi:pimeloyl-ACP methyl ester carboxylesterase
VKERTLLFGERKSLVGVITERAASPSPTGSGVIFLNAGVLHRVGPNRIHVRLARELARDGFVSMRFDFSGLGDSRPRADPAPFVEAAVAETRQAMDVLGASHGLRSFLLVGMCSGADNALRAAGHDGRVGGAALIEPYSVPPSGFLLYSYRKKLLNPRSWWRLLRGRSELVGLLRESRADEVGAGPDPAAGSLIPPREELVRQVRALLDRGGQLCLVYSAGSPAHFNYLSILRRELRKALREGQARLHVLKRTDHVFTPLSAQESLVAAVRQWALGAAGGASSARPGT